LVGHLFDGDGVAVAKFEANLRVPVRKRNETAQGRPIYFPSGYYYGLRVLSFFLRLRFLPLFKEPLKRWESKYDPLAKTVS
jgi:hypothetical protein